MSYYEKKYLKYKMKYLSLKNNLNKNGGSPKLTEDIYKLYPKSTYYKEYLDHADFLWGVHYPTDKDNLDEIIKKSRNQKVDQFNKIQELPFEDIKFLDFVRYYVNKPDIVPIDSHRKYAILFKVPLIDGRPPNWIQLRNSQFSNKMQKKEQVIFKAKTEELKNRLREIVIEPEIYKKTNKEKPDKDANILQRINKDVFFREFLKEFEDRYKPYIARIFYFNIYLPGRREAIFSDIPPINMIEGVFKDIIEKNPKPKYKPGPEQPKYKYVDISSNYNIDTKKDLKTDLSEQLREQNFDWTKILDYADFMWAIFLTNDEKSIKKIIEDSNKSENGTLVMKRLIQDADNFYGINQLFTRYYLNGPVITPYDSSTRYKYAIMFKIPLIKGRVPIWVNLKHVNGYDFRRYQIMDTDPDIDNVLFKFKNKEVEKILKDLVTHIEFEDQAARDSEIEERLKNNQKAFNLLKDYPIDSNLTLPQISRLIYLGFIGEHHAIFNGIPPTKLIDGVFKNKIEEEPKNIPNSPLFDKSSFHFVDVSKDYGIIKE